MFGIGALYNILSYSIGSLFIGVLLTAVGIILMFVLIRGWWRNCQFSAVSYVAGVVLFFFLSFQSVLICGAITIKSYADDVYRQINTLIESVEQSHCFSKEESQQVLERITDEYPLVGYYVGGADFTNHTPQTLAGAMVDELHSFMNKFIMRRVLWSLLFITVGAIAVIKTISREYATARRGRRDSAPHRTARRNETRRATTRTARRRR